MTDTALSHAPTEAETTPPGHDLAPDPRHGLTPLGEVKYVLRGWHNENHPGAAGVCLLEPCRAINTIIDLDRRYDLHLKTDNEQ